MLICKGILILVCIIVLMTILLPAASGSVEGDARGGDTDVTEQLNMVFGHPIAYVRIFFADVVNTLNEYVFNAFGLTSLAYAGSHPFAGAVSLLCLGSCIDGEKASTAFTQKEHFFYESMACSYSFRNIRAYLVGSLYCVYTGWKYKYRRCSGQILHSAGSSDFYVILYK